ncbi:hypothetical protein BDV25DRAFT_4966 [Aspergillus avenaceus]|uniref:Uncharacterized protein n=1 Tax=Aspergillus avenaceus TaxID=36643 RepID=A0A5N6TSB9_ASPAV|nr:hypothetical protein BDV25DRAFT_4966 [Aspergillus avenaceus]
MIVADVCSSSSLEPKAYAQWAFFDRPSLVRCSFFFSFLFFLFFLFFIFFLTKTNGTAHWIYHKNVIMCA